MHNLSSVLAEATNKSSAFMRKLSSAKSEDAARALIAGLRKLGGGEGRDVLELSDNAVIKLAKNDNGLKQNATEAATSARFSDCPIARVVATSRSALGEELWIACERVTTLTKAQIDDAVADILPDADSLYGLVSMIDAGLHERWAAREPEAHWKLELGHERALRDSRWYASLFRVVQGADVSIDELRHDNFGMRAGELVLLDYGQ